MIDRQIFILQQATEPKPEESELAKALRRARDNTESSTVSGG